MTEAKPRILLTPGPLTTSPETKQAMLHDWGSRDAAFIDMTADLCTRLTTLAGVADSHVCVPLQGSGTFIVEAILGTLIPRDGKALILINGAYGKRMVRICEYLNRACVTLETPENVPPTAEDVETALRDDPTITHVAAVHCETTSGILNPIAEIAAVTAAHGRGLIIDAMSSFGALPLSTTAVPFAALVASSNKCLQGVPGVGFAIIDRLALQETEGNAHSLSLDLYDQWRALEKTGQWRFTPPTHVIAALQQALEEHAIEGGIDGRGARYARNCHVLVEGMRAMGFKTFLSDNLQAPIIVTFHTPADPHFDFAQFYDGLADRGIVIYPGKLTEADSFRIGCIGDVHEDDMRRALSAIRAVLDAMGVSACTPRQAAG